MVNPNGIPVRRRVHMVIQQFGEPVTVAQVALKMRMPPERVSSEVSKLAMYGYLTVVDRGGDAKKRKSYRYVPSDKPIIEAAEATLVP